MGRRHPAWVRAQAFVNVSPDSHSAEDVIRLLGLEPIPREGGWFRRLGAGGETRRDGRQAWSCIQALFTPAGFSALHRLAADELWSFHAGDALETMHLFPDGSGRRGTLGLALAESEQPQVVVPAGVWQGARLHDGGRWALVSCVVVPEFRWEDFTLGDRASLSASHPRWVDAVRRFTRD